MKNGNKSKDHIHLTETEIAALPVSERCKYEYRRRFDTMKILCKEYKTDESDLDDRIREAKANEEKLKIECKMLRAAFHGKLPGSSRMHSGFNSINSLPPTNTAHGIADKLSHVDLKESTKIKKRVSFPTEDNLEKVLLFKSGDDV